MSWKDMELEVIRWAEARMIVPRSTPMAQAIKTLEEVKELLEAIHKGDYGEMVDAYGDVLVTLIIGAALADVDLVRCLEAAYGQIKDRKGTLGPDGIFRKEA